MSDLRFLITGATGATGGAAAVQLLEQGRQVRAFVHRADERSENLRKLGAEVVVGDLLEFDAVRDALKGVDRAYFVYPIRSGPAWFKRAVRPGGDDTRRDRPDRRTGPRQGDQVSVNAHRKMGGAGATAQFAQSAKEAVWRG